MALSLLFTSITTSSKYKYIDSPKSKVKVKVI